MTSKRLQALVLTAALAAGYGGAAVYTAVAAPSLPVVTDFGPGDGLSRYVVTAAGGRMGDDVLAGLTAVDGVVSAQPLSDGRALVATSGTTPRDLTDVAGVSAVEPSVSVPLAATVTDPLFAGYGWHLENTGSNAPTQNPVVAGADIDVTDGWDVARGAGIVVAVIDSGFDSDHPDLVGSLWVNPAEPCGSADTDGNGKRGDCHGWNWYAGGPDVDNGSYGGHGAMVSGALGARAGNGAGLAGVAPEVTIMPLVIGGGSTVDVYAGAEAIRYAVDHGADVINASWGGPISGGALTALRSAVDYAAAHDVLVVASAGNDSGNRDTSAVYPAGLTQANVLTVGSSTAADTVSGFSGYGATAVDLFAPGTQVAVTTNDGGYALANGTSFSAPVVSGAVALYRAVMPGASAAELRAALLDDVDRLPAFAGRSVSGGRLSLSGLADLSTAPADRVSYAFTSMTSAPGTVAPRIGVSGSAPAGTYAVELGLGMEHAGEIWALADAPVTVGGVTVPTDDAGGARFHLGPLTGLEGLGLSPTVPLGEGRYVLTVRLLRDGEPVGRASAAPLLVGSSGSGGTPPGTAPSTPPGTAPSTPPGSSPSPTSPAPAAPTPAPVPGVTPRPGVTPQPGIPAQPGTPTQPAVPTPGGTAPATPAPPRPGTTSPATPAPATPTPGTTSPGAPTPGSPATPTPRPSTPATPTPSTPATPTPGTPAQPTIPGDRTTAYPSVGAFRVTSLGPNTVPAVGGTLVTITGTALPVPARVLIGSSVEATVVSASATRLQFRTPARVAGSYDVTVFAADGRQTLLPAALRYADVPAGTPTAPAPGSPAPGTPAPPTTPAAPTTPATPTTPAPGTSPGGPAAGSGPVERAGPRGERLVRSATFGALRGLWAVDCTASCTGVTI